MTQDSSTLSLMLSPMPTWLNTWWKQCAKWKGYLIQAWPRPTSQRLIGYIIISDLEILLKIKTFVEKEVKQGQSMPWDCSCICKTTYFVQRPIETN